MIQRCARLSRVCVFLEIWWSSCTTWSLTIPTDWRNSAGKVKQKFQAFHKKTTTSISSVENQPFKKKNQGILWWQRGWIRGHLPPRGHLQEQRLRRLRGKGGEGGGVAECRAQGICIKKLNTYHILYDISYDFSQIVLSISFFNSIIYIFVVSTFLFL